MDSELTLRRLIEYSICEYAIIAYTKSNGHSLSFQSFCERIRESILDGKFSKWEEGTLFWIMRNTNKIYCYPDEEFDEILGSFFICRKWNKYYRAIRLMKNVKCTIN